MVPDGDGLHSGGGHVHTAALAAGRVWVRRDGLHRCRTDRVSRGLCRIGDVWAQIRRQGRDIDAHMWRGGHGAADDGLMGDNNKGRRK